MENTYQQPINALIVILHALPAQVRVIQHALHALLDTLQIQEFVPSVIMNALLVTHNQIAYLAKMDTTSALEFVLSVLLDALNAQAHLNVKSALLLTT